MYFDGLNMPNAIENYDSSSFSAESISNIDIGEYILNGQFAPTYGSPAVENQLSYTCNGRYLNFSPNAISTSPTSFGRADITNFGLWTTHLSPMQYRSALPSNFAPFPTASAYSYIAPTPPPVAFYPSIMPLVPVCDYQQSSLCSISQDSAIVNESINDDQKNMTSVEI